MRLTAFAGASFLLLLAQSALAAPILAPPGDPAFDSGLDALAKGFQRQQDVFATLESGLSLDVVFQPSAVGAVQGFFAQSASDDFQQVSGQHPYEVISSFGEWGDEGNFSGISSVGVAARLIALRASGAPAAEIDRARAAAVRAAQAWHVYGAIGGPGIVARGVRRVTPWSSGDPPFPGSTPATTPLADGQGNPLPSDKEPVWRDPVASGFDGWIWMDDTSKDQVSGYALAAAWLWDALSDDPSVPPNVTADLADDLDAFAKQLMKVAPEFEIDLCIRDADGRLTSFHDLNPRQVVPDAVIAEKLSLRNGFNAAMALGILRAAYHVSGDPELGKYYYEDLVGQRNLPANALTNAGIIFTGASTNYSNVNMLAIALATLGRFETDPGVRATFEQVLDTQFWSTGSDRDVSHVKQAWFDAIYGAYAASPPAEIPARISQNLGGFQPAPAFERDRVNCDDNEIAAGSCVAVDGTTVIELLGSGHGGSPVAKDIVPMSIRPDTDFAWRSDPHDVNGNASSMMDPRGDWLTAYWLARVSELGDSGKNISPHARPPLPYSQGDGGTAGAAGAAGAGGGSSKAAPADSDGGCSACSTGRGTFSESAWLTWFCAALSFGARRRARRSRR
jgi:hypothetical protein